MISSLFSPLFTICISYTYCAVIVRLSEFYGKGVLFDSVQFTYALFRIKVYYKRKLAEERGLSGEDTILSLVK